MILQIPQAISAMTRMAARHKVMTSRPGCRVGGYSSSNWSSPSFSMGCRTDILADYVQDGLGGVAQHEGQHHA